MTNNQMDKKEDETVSVYSGVLSIELKSSSKKSSYNVDESTVFSPGVHNAKIYGKYYRHPIQRVFIFFSLFLICYAYGLDNSTRKTYQTLATSSYKKHSLMSTVTCIKKVISAAGQIWFARASDIFGREFILFLSIMFYSVGTIVESQAFDINKYAAGAILYGLGHAGIVLTTEVYAADFSQLNWRVVAAAAPMLPNLINTWVSGNIASDIGDHWKWGIGMWAILFPVSCLPLIVCLVHMRYLAHKNNEDIKPVFIKPSSQYWKEYIIDMFFWKLDILGLVLLVFIFGLILIPFTLAGGIHKKWIHASIIVPEVIGWVLAIPLFVLWEFKFAKYPIIQWNTIKDRGIWSALVISLFIEFCFYMHDTYFYTFLLVAVNETTKSGTRIDSLSSFVTVLTAFFLGFLIVKVRRTKSFIIFGCIIYMVAHGLFVNYNGGLSSHAGLIGAICLLGFGNGFIKFPVRASIQASSGSHEKLAIITSLFLAVGSIGTAFGSAVAGAIWSNIMPEQIQSRITNETLAEKAYSSPTTFIKTYKWNSTERMALVKAYGYVWKILNIVGLVLVVPMILASLFLRDRKLENILAFDEQDEQIQEKTAT